MKSKLKTGDILIAKSKCKMRSSGKNALTIGKEYSIEYIDEIVLLITDDDNCNHRFMMKSKDTAYWGRFFKRKKIV